MKPEDVQDLLSSIDLHASKLDRTHVKQLYNMAAEVGAGVCNNDRRDAHRILIHLFEHAYVLKKRHIKRLYRIAIDYDLNPKCYVCNQPITNIRDFSWDHIFPHSKGGSDDLENLIPMHKLCNEIKGAQVFEHLGDVHYVIIVPQIIVLNENCRPRYKKLTNSKRAHKWKFEQQKYKKR